MELVTTNKNVKTTEAQDYRFILSKRKSERRCALFTHGIKALDPACGN